MRASSERDATGAVSRAMNRDAAMAMLVPMASNTAPSPTSCFSFLSTGERTGVRVRRTYAAGIARNYTRIAEGETFFAAAWQDWLGSTGHWPVPAGDPPDGTGEAQLFSERENSCVPLFRAASRRSARAGRPCHPPMSHDVVVPGQCGNT